MKIILTFISDSSLYPQTRGLKTIAEIRVSLLGNSSDDGLQLISVNEAPEEYVPSTSKKESNNE